MRYKLLHQRGRILARCEPDRAAAHRGDLTAKSLVEQRGEGSSSTHVSLPAATEPEGGRIHE